MIVHHKEQRQDLLAGNATGAFVCSMVGNSSSSGKSLIFMHTNQNDMLGLEPITPSERVLCLNPKEAESSTHQRRRSPPRAFEPLLPMDAITEVN